jgi:hypothetical protein
VACVSSVSVPDVIEQTYRYLGGPFPNLFDAYNFIEVMLMYEVISEADDPIVHEGSVYVRKA